MLFSIRRVTAPRVGALLSNRALVHPRFRLHAVHNARVVNEDELLTRAFPRAGRIERPILTVLLSGRARISAHGQRRWLEPGEALMMDSKGAILMRQEGDPYASLAFEWDEGWLAPRPEPFARLPLGARDIDTMQSLWRELVESPAPDGERVVGSLLDTLAGAGAPFVARTTSSIKELCAAAPPRFAHLSRALDEVLSDLSAHPMATDLEERLGVSTRQLQRVVADFNARYGYNAGGWIDARNRRRIMFGATFMTAPAATAAYVAGVVGFASHASFTRALVNAGLPPPSNIASEVAALARA